MKSYSLIALAVVCTLALVLWGSSCAEVVKPPDDDTDTTSHDFTWELFTLGDGASSVLYDVAIINDTLAYAVGEIYLRDSTGEFDPFPYGLARWDGSTWNLQKVPYHDFGSTERYPGKLNTIHGFGADDIFVSSSANLLHWDGNTWTEKAFFMTDIPFNGQVMKMWGMSNSNIYCVGRGGAIYHYNGGNWQKLESGTTLDIQDIWGAYTIKGFGKLEIEMLAVASNPGSSFDRKILQIAGTSVSTISDTPIAYPLQSVWFAPDKHYYVVGTGIYVKNSLADELWQNEPLEITQFGTTKVRGNTANDVVVVGAFGECLHWNGVSWMSYREQTALSTGSFAGVAIKQNLVIAVGADNGRAVALIGRR